MEEVATDKPVSNPSRQIRRPTGREIMRIILIILAVLLIALAAFMYLSQLNIDLINFYIKFNGVAEDRINYIAFHEIGNDTNQTVLIKKILIWENENIRWVNDSYPCPRASDNILLQNKYWTSITMCGECGEFTGMFSEIASRFGIENRVITADNINGGNHAWVEIIKGNQTTPVETTDINGFNSSEFYKCRWLIQYKSIRTDSGEDISKTYYNRCS
jgi:hypothetical protein